ncbi:MAG: Glutathione biosynthesis bifunctional protein GshAB [Chlamydiia bacterium]|nr:Glutathione biosynthesis bifunctional protein GshAB [Chlamydiia bacterium]MCH9618173.1 Glutathione biosynthesis bifunctional protein GshAB [Chlamydiia bacterium]MCH9624483.1 Glutathione biosynthesis bifunctional protein GshAB [Chlamydiia bacterium]
MKKREPFQVGLEREALRITKTGIIDTSSHPESFGDKLYHQYITADFSESQLELITAPHTSNEKALKELEKILSFIHFKEPEMIIHNNSMPVDGTAFPARFGCAGKDKEEYRKYLLGKYGLQMQLISGIHYNFSIDGLSNEQYLHIIRNTIRYGYLFPSLFGNSFSKEFPDATSIRGSSKGYFPTFQRNIPVDFNSVQGYLQSLEQRKDLSSEKEYYFFIKPKFSCGKIQYMELRAIDIDSNAQAGITIETMHFIKDFFFKMKQLASPPMSDEEFSACKEKYETICLEGQKQMHKKDVENLLKELDLAIPVYKTPKKIEIKNHLYLEKATEASVYKTLECSTRLLIADALDNGIKVSIIDRETNTIQLKKGAIETIISQATFTEKDSFISYRLQKDKHLTKKLLKAASLQVPSGAFFPSKDIDLNLFLGKKICIKPVYANYGDGISILHTNDQIELTAAIDKAFKHSSSILIEDFFKGSEYRLLVIDGKEVFACKRSPPEVIGDGKSSLDQLINQANRVRPPEFPIKYDGELDTILEKGEKRLLRENTNVSTGGTAKDETDNIDESYKEIARKAARAIKGFLCGVDMIIKDIKTPATKDNYVILETNFNPALYLHQHPLFGGRKVSSSLFKVLGILHRHH